MLLRHDCVASEFAVNTRITCCTVTLAPELPPIYARPRHRWRLYCWPLPLLIVHVQIHYYCCALLLCRPFYPGEDAVPWPQQPQRTDVFCLKRRKSCVGTEVQHSGRRTEVFQLELRSRLRGHYMTCPSPHPSNSDPTSSNVIAMTWPPITGRSCGCVSEGWPRLDWNGGICSTGQT